MTASIANALADPNAMNEITQKLRAQVAAAFSANAMVDGVIAGYEQAIRRVPAPCWHTPK
jgi:hypothetical protein